MATKKTTKTTKATSNPYKVTSYENWNKKIMNDVNKDADYQAAKAKLAETEGAKPTYAGTYDNDVANAYNNIVNRDKFQYNLDDDALYKQYADKYMAAGKLAMKNSMGQTAALTGGYGSSYGSAVGQQTYDAYLQGLNDKALEMYDRAYQRYQDEGDQLKDVYGLAKDMADTEYGRYTDQLGQWNTDRSFNYGAMQDAYGNAYNRGNEAFNRYNTDQETAYNYANQLAAYGDFSALETLFGKEAAANAANTWAMQNPDAAFARGLISADQYNDITGKYPTGYGPAGGGGGGGYRKRKKKGDDSLYKSMNKYLDTNKSTTSNASNLQVLNDAATAYKQGALTKKEYQKLTTKSITQYKPGNADDYVKKLLSGAYK